MRKGGREALQSMGRGVPGLVGLRSMEEMRERKKMKRGKMKKGSIVNIQEQQRYPLSRITKKIKPDQASRTAAMHEYFLSPS